jgi:abortive infection bacteriophage resistance protein
MKTAKTYEEQIYILKSRGILVNDELAAIEVLKNVNYYNFTGYMYQFKDGSGYDNISFEKVYEIYKFDTEIKNMLSNYINEIEQKLKTRIAYEIANFYKDEPYILDRPDFFADSSEYRKLITEFQRTVENNKNIPFVIHHQKKYSGKFPIWVAIELFTLGNLAYLYKNMNSRIKKNISRQFNVSPSTFLNWLSNLRVTRNFIAHNMRLYNTTWITSPVFERHQITFNTNRVFSQLKILSYLVNDKAFFVNELEKIVNKYSDNIDFKLIGFPEDWKEILTK